MYLLQYSSAEIKMESECLPYHPCGGSLWVVMLNTRMPSAVTAREKKILVLHAQDDNLVKLSYLKDRRRKHVIKGVKK